MRPGARYPLHNPWPVDLEAVAVERAKERRQCPYYEKCLIRAAYHSPGLWVPCAACQGSPIDLEGLEALILGFEDHHGPDERYGPQVAYQIRPGDGGHCESVFSYAAMQKARRWLADKDSDQIFVNKYLCIY